MNKFDRTVGIWVQLQTHLIIPAKKLSETYTVSLRTIYRDIKTLESVGVPIISIPKQGYSLAKGYRLSPLSLTKKEIFSLLIASKFFEKYAHGEKRKDSVSAFSKIYSTLNEKDLVDLKKLKNQIEVYDSNIPPKSDIKFEIVETSILNSEALNISYLALDKPLPTKRKVYPIGLLHYSGYWHLIGYCFLRKSYRDFRIDRIQSISNSGEFFDRKQYLSIKKYQKINKEKIDSKSIKIILKTLTNCELDLTQIKKPFDILSTTKTKNQLHLEIRPFNTNNMLRWVLAYSDQILLVQPNNLVKKIKSMINNINTLY